MAHTCQYISLGRNQVFFVWVGLSELLVFLFFVLGLDGLHDAEDFKNERRPFFGSVALPENFDILVEAPILLEGLFTLFVVTIMLPMSLLECLMSCDEQIRGSAMFC